MISKKTVSVVILAEKAPEQSVNEAIDNVLKQTHKTLDLIVVSAQRDDLDKLKARWATVNNLRWIVSEADGLGMLEAGVKEVKGDYVFYRTIGPAEWLPRHIEHHLDLFTWDKKASWSHSLIEFHNFAEQSAPFNLLQFRIDKPPKLDQVIIDELCHEAFLKIDFRKLLITLDGGKSVRFFPGAVFDQFKDHRLAVPDEITISQWTDPRPPVPVLGAPKSTNNVEEEVVELPDGQMGIKVQYPTIVGNVQYRDHNKIVLERIKDTKPEEITKIAIKRTIGMGDVVLVEPVIRALRQRYPNAEITMYTGATRGAKDIVPYFAARPDLIIGDLGEDKIVQDLLYDQKGYDLRFDLDLAYESRVDVNYIDAYFSTAGFVDEIVEKDGRLVLENPVPISERAPALIYEEPRLIHDKYVTVALDGSGWQGKEWSQENWQSILLDAHARGYRLAHVSNNASPSLFSPDLDQIVFTNPTNDFNKMLNFLRYAEFHIGADNGPMHLAAALGKKCFVVAGAAIPSMTSRSTNIWQVTNPNLTCLHCKGKQFYNPNGQGGITFVSNCLIADQFACMKKLEVSYVLEQFKQFQLAITK